MCTTIIVQGYDYDPKNNSVLIWDKKEILLSNTFKMLLDDLETGIINVPHLSTASLAIMHHYLHQVITWQNAKTDLHKNTAPDYSERLAILIKDEKCSLKKIYNLMETALYLDIKIVLDALLIYLKSSTFFSVPSSHEEQEELFSLLKIGQGLDLHYQNDIAYEIIKKNILPFITQKKVLQSSSKKITSLALSADNSWSARGLNDGSIVQWDHATDEHCYFPKGHTQAVTILRLSSDNGLLASAGDDNIIILWEMPTKKRVASFEGHTKRITELEFTHQNDEVISASDDGTVKVWWTNPPLFIYNIIIINSPITALTIQPGKTNSTFAYASDGQAILLHVEDKKNPHIYTPSYNNKKQPTITALAFSHDGHLLFAVSDDAQVFLWNVATGHYLHSLSSSEKIKKIIPTPLPHYFATLTSNTLIMWHIKDECFLEKQIFVSEPLNDVDFAANGSGMITVSKKGTITLWNIPTQQSGLPSCREMHTILNATTKQENDVSLTKTNSAKLLPLSTLLIGCIMSGIATFSLLQARK